MSDKPILVVDDDAGQAELVASLLTQRGYRVVTAGNGRRALELLAEDPPRLILLDLIMPVMTGYEFLRHLWAMDALQDIPVIVISGAHVPNPGGVVGFLRKPIHPGELLSVVSRLAPLPRDPGDNLLTPA